MRALVFLAWASAMVAGAAAAAPAGKLRRAPCSWLCVMINQDRPLNNNHYDPNSHAAARFMRLWWKIGPSLPD